MGGIGLSLPLTSAPKDAVARAQLLEAIWKHCYERMLAVTKKKVAKDILSIYTSDEAYDGLLDGSWYASEHELMFSFGDAAGLCMGEMDASQHWLLMTVLDQFAELSKIAETKGATLALPQTHLLAKALADGRFVSVVFQGEQTQQLASLLTKNAEVFFYCGAKLGYGRAHDSPPADHEIYFFPADGGAKTVLLAKAPKADRDRVTELVKTGVCACEVCQALRTKYGLPLAPEAPKKASAPRKPPKPPPPAPTITADLATATLRYGWELDALRANPASVVALDCSGRKSPPLIRALPSFPLRALGLRGYTTRALVPEILQLKDLRVLSLNGTELTQPVNLDGLDELRALDLSGIFNDGAFSGTYRDRPKLDIVDVAHWVRRDAKPLLMHGRLRNINTAGIEEHFSLLDKHPVEMLRMGAQIDHAVLSRWPLRFVELGKGLTVTSNARFVELGYQEASVPDWVRALPDLTGLSARWAEELPEWLAEMPKLQVLVLAHSPALAKQPEKFKVIEKLKHLRVLVLAPDGGDRLPFDLSALTQLEYLSATWAKVRTVEDFVTGFEHVKKLYFSTEWDAATTQKFIERHPFAERDGNTLRGWSFLTIYRWLLAPSDPSHWLARLSTGGPWPTPPSIVW